VGFGPAAEFPFCQLATGWRLFVARVIVKLTKRPSLAKVLALKFPIVC
jgi:hypothetical protein